MSIISSPGILSIGGGARIQLISALPIGDTLVDVTFVPLTVPDASFDIKRNGVTIATVSGSQGVSQIYHDSGLTGQTTYTYTVVGHVSTLSSLPVQATTLGGFEPGLFESGPQEP